ncbi:MAG TPA: AlpA family phage regulatory protein [Sedimentisphaerales bacterium]|nr:AlpA family phage regulatory protein [Sedimentisphaerales bacterium]
METKHTQSEIQLLTAKQLGGLLSLSKRQVFRLSCCGKLPPPIRIGGSVRWANSTIESWIDMGCPDRQTFEAMRGGEKC